MPTMTSKKKIVTDLQSALSGHKPLSIDLYVEVLADYEDELKASLDKDADDALLCMLADDGDVAMMVIDWDGSIYRNENALKKPTSPSASSMLPAGLSSGTGPWLLWVLPR